MLIDYYDQRLPTERFHEPTLLEDCRDFEAKELKFVWQAEKSKPN